MSTFEFRFFEAPEEFPAPPRSLIRVAKTAVVSYPEELVTDAISSECITTQEVVWEVERLKRELDLIAARASRLFGKPK